MTTPDPTPSAPPPKPTVSVQRQIISWVLLAAVLIATGIVIYLKYFGRRVKMSDVEEVQYAGSATADDARKVGKALQQSHYFDGVTEAVAKIGRDSKGWTLTLVTVDPPMLYHESVAQDVAKTLGARTITLRFENAKGKITEERTVNLPKGVVPSTQPDD